MAKFTKVLKERFTQIPNETVCNRNISFKARGILQYLLSRPDNWIFYETQIASMSEKDGLYSVRQGLKELEANKLLIRKRERLDNGHWGDNEYIVCDCEESYEKYINKQRNLC